MSGANELVAKTDSDSRDLFNVKKNNGRFKHWKKQQKCVEIALKMRIFGFIFKKISGAHPPTIGKGLKRHPCRRFASTPHGAFGTSYSRRHYSDKSYVHSKESIT